MSNAMNRIVTILNPEEYIEAPRLTKMQHRTPDGMIWESYAWVYSDQAEERRACEHKLSVLLYPQWTGFDHDEIVCEVPYLQFCTEVEVSVMRVRSAEALHAHLESLSDADLRALKARSEARGFELFEVEQHHQRLAERCEAVLEGRQQQNTATSVRDALQGRTVLALLPGDESMPALLIESWNPPQEDPLLEAVMFHSYHETVEMAGYPEVQIRNDDLRLSLRSRSWVPLLHMAHDLGLIITNMKNLQGRLRAQLGVAEQHWGKM